MNAISPTAEARPVTGNTPVSPHGAGSLTAQARQSVMAAARYAEHAYPGPIGEVLSRELRSYAEDGEQLPPHASAPRLVLMVRRQEARNPLPPAPGYAPRRRSTSQAAPCAGAPARSPTRSRTCVPPEGDYNRFKAFAPSSAGARPAPMTRGSFERYGRGPGPDGSGRARGEGQATCHGGAPV